MKPKISLLFLLLFFACSVSSVFAGEHGHYTPAPLAVRDLVMPPKGVYFLNYNLYYKADTFKDASGVKITDFTASGTATRNISLRGYSIPVTFTGTGTINLDFDIDVYAQTFGLAVVTDKKIFGADYGFLILPSWGHARFDATANATAAGTISVGGVSKPIAANRTVKFEDDTTGLADLLIQPLWFAWRDKHYDIGLSWGAYLPTGQYDKDDLANIGLGFFTSKLQPSFFYYPFESKATAFMFSPTWEWHSKKIDKDVQPGQNITIEYGLSQYLHERFEIGISGFHQWQVTDDSGGAAVNKDTHDRISGVGAQATWWAIKDKCALVVKYVKEYDAVDRLEGELIEFNMTLAF
ncbi:MAG: transporter [Omnitrophica bacterium]|nr:transporter [Candidatus Omnitrophota bacterium]